MCVEDIVLAFNTSSPSAIASMSDAELSTARTTLKGKRKRKPKKREGEVKSDYSGKRTLKLTVTLEC